MKEPDVIENDKFNGPHIPAPTPTLSDWMRILKMNGSLLRCMDASMMTRTDTA